jgi:hypothetical protein
VETDPASHNLRLNLSISESVRGVVQFRTDSQLARADELHKVICHGRDANRLQAKLGT